ncbi:hypothetical protein ER308_15120 [Egibacter rhizosphaerae]|uniref:Uncharacterized protein n=1 Tax=Egibacter rhizosphaerae TaxID=1670831 RepID=A0A411YI66_9ACTN|nr:hypothetical protein [Egibacter rhizosphaerae]QBI20762.1 hypothetical protein ER308_15120 [Egibacter rhizosphaerae]
MISDQQVEAQRVADRWLVDADSLERLAAAPRASGRPWSPQVAWACLRWLDGEQRAVAALAAVDRSRLRRRLQAPVRLEALAPRLVRRARPLRLHGHPSVLRDVEHAGCATGLSAAAALKVGLAVREGEQADVYVPEGTVDGLVAALALRPVEASGGANVTLRRVPDAAWQLEGRTVAPVAAAALDLAEHADTRSHAAARELAARVESRDA